MTRPLLPPVTGTGPWLITCHNPVSDCVVVAQTTTVTETMTVLRALLGAGLTPRVRSL